MGKESKRKEEKDEKVEKGSADAPDESETQDLQGLKDLQDLQGSYHEKENVRTCLDDLNSLKKEIVEIKYKMANIEKKINKFANLHTLETAMVSFPKQFFFYLNKQNNQT